MFDRKRTLEKEFDNRLRSLMMKTKEEWEQAKEIERYLNDYDQEVIARRKIAESKHFYLFKEARARHLGRD
ncbi:YaaL family protein [Sporosarcina limicola]|uniref:Precorrin-2 methylase n=1 Tax=Sporosarcina limicola TaxID=34101 RepID=A0A927RH20_9BACL|nr:YaaL family protein [Sporosarcina limicola]MBE1557042.1 precorrin-2 methylase [Sporosarcina limicola]